VLLIPRFLGFGAALSTVMAFAVRWALTYYLSQKLWPVAYRWNPVIRLCLLSVGVSLVGILLPEVQIVLSILIQMGLFCVFPIAVWHGGILTDVEKRTFRTMIRKGIAMILALRSAPR